MKLTEYLQFLKKVIKNNDIEPFTTFDYIKTLDGNKWLDITVCNN